MAFRLKDTKDSYLRQPDMLEDLTEKAYLFEFYSADAAAAEDSFIFSLPPEAEEISHTFRKAETPTFSGLHIDDYGMNAARISLSGSTWNQRLKRVMINGAPQFMSGEDEIYYYRDLWHKYKSYKNGMLTRRIVMTDLSKTNASGRATETKDAYYFKGYIASKYEIFPSEFKISRDKSKPLVYNYTLDMTAVLIDSSSMIGASSKKKETPPTRLEKVIAECGRINARADAIGASVAGFYAKVEDACDDVRIASNQVKQAAGKVIGICTNTLNATANALAGITDTVFAIPQDVMGIMFNAADEMMNSTNNLLKSIDGLKENIVSLKTQEYWVPQSMLDKLNLDGNELGVTCRKIAGDLDEQRNEIEKDVLQASSDANTYVETAVTENGQEITVSNKTYYGSANYQIKESDTLEGIAMAAYGTIAFMQDILLYNGLASISDLKAGATIRIPQVNPAIRQTQDIVRYQRGDTDNYGADIMLDDDGSIVVSGDDFERIHGVANLNQAILLRLRDSVSRRIRKQAYGIAMSLGSGQASNSYIISSIYETMMAEPRVCRVDGISYRGVGDYLEVNIKYTDVNNMSSQFTQRV